MSLNRREFLSITGLWMGSLLTGCGVSGGEPDYTVVIESTGGFNPASLVIPVGAMVAWHNRADHVHTVTADPSQALHSERVQLPTGAPTFHSGDLFSGERWSYVFDVPGTYIYFCRYHELDEMLGSITVIA